MRIGVIGAGAISPLYLRYLTRRDDVTVAAIADLNLERAASRAREFSLSAGLTPAALLARGDIDLVLNLTTPAAHASVSAAALHAGKHVYSEKPLAISPTDGARLVSQAAAAGRHLACAPDTILGSGIQTAIQALDAGVIGRPVGATLAFLNHGHEHWHPDPAFYYQPGGGPVLDMGPYYVTALVSLLGPVTRVVSLAAQTFARRIVTSPARAGEEIVVGVPTHVVGLLETAAKVPVQVTMSFDVWHHTLPHVEIYGTEGTLEVPDPNTFGGPVRVRRADEAAARELPLRPDLPQEQARGVGVVDLVHAVREGRPGRLDGVLGAHVLDVLAALARGGDTVITSTVSRPLPVGTS